MLFASFSMEELKAWDIPEQYQRRYDPCGAGDPSHGISIVLMVIGNKQLGATFP
jgi:hypothetical protein